MKAGYGILLLFLFSVSNGAWAFDLAFETRVEPAPRKDLHVEATITGWVKPEITFRFPYRVGPATGVYQHVRDFEVSNNGLILPVRYEAPDSAKGYARYSAAVSPGEIRVRYRMDAPDYSDAHLLGTVYGVIQSDHAMINGNATYFDLDVPTKEYGKVALKFDVPAGWKVYCSSIQLDEHTCALDYQGDPANVLDALLSQMTPVGNWERESIQIEGMNLEILRAGKWGFPFGRFLEMIQRPLIWQIQKMGGHNRSKYQIIVDTYPEEAVINGHLSGGQHLFDSTVSMAMRDATENDFSDYNLHTIAHEFHHTFAWAYPRGEGNRLTWFNEGMTDYMSWQSLLETGFVKARFATYLLQDLELYWNQTISKQISIREASQDRWESSDRPWTQEQLDFALYEQVDLAAWVLDAKAQLLGVSVRLSDVMRELWQRYGKRGLTLTEDEIFAVASAVFAREPGAQKLIEDWVHSLSTTDELELTPLLQAQGLRLEEAWRADFGVYVRNFSGRLLVTEFAPYLDRDEIAKLVLQPGDVVRSLNGTPLSTTQDLWKLVYQLPVSGTARIQVERGGSIMDVDVPIRPYHEVRKLSHVASPNATFPRSRH